MPVAIELQNLGDAQLCREIVASIEHALSDKRGEWRVGEHGRYVLLHAPGASAHTNHRPTTAALAPAVSAVPSALRGARSAALDPCPPPSRNNTAMRRWP